MEFSPENLADCDYYVHLNLLVQFGRITLLQLLSDMKSPLVKSFTLLLALAVGLALPAQAADRELRPLPGSEFKAGTAKRVTKRIPVAELVEGSPEWVLTKATQARFERNYEEERKYVSPVKLWNHRQEQEAWLNEYKSRVSFTDFLFVSDTGMDENSAYIFAGFTNRGNQKRSSANYQFFLKVNGEWIWVDEIEWQEGELRPAPGS